MIVDSLVKVITTTKIKSVCNLGVWCISIQQFNGQFLVAHFDSLLIAIAHALDNPIGSLSTTFEAMQAVMKLASQIGEKMRDLSNIWAPSIYRRLLSAEKRERDMSIRCLLKIRSTICPPPLSLSKAVLLDMKKMLLPGMMELINNGMKVQALQAWGWFISLLGYYAVKNKHLVNEMLKILEQTFSDMNPQVQIASLVAWEGLIDALVHPPSQTPETNMTQEHGIQQTSILKGNSSVMEADGYLKRIKLIMTPLQGFMSSKCEASVQSSCLNTWSYLLHKLDTSVNCTSVMKTVLEPIFEIVFKVGPDSRNICFWNFCVDLLDNFALQSKDKNSNLNEFSSGDLSDKSPAIRTPTDSKYPLKLYPIKWLPWDLNQLEFFLRMINILISQEINVTVTPEIKSSVGNAALRIFRSVLKRVQHILKCSSTTYEEVMLSLKTILGFLKKICEDVTSEEVGTNDLHCNSLQFIEAVAEVLEPNFLGSPIYKVVVDLKFINILDSATERRHTVPLHFCSLALMDMVSPIVYLNILYFSVVVKSIMGVSLAESNLLGMHRYIKLLLSSYDPTEVLHVFNGLLYEDTVHDCINIWITIVNCLKEYMDGVKDYSLFKMESDSHSYLAVCHLLSYRLAICCCLQKQSILQPCSDNIDASLVPSQSQRELELQHVFEVWKKLFVSISCALQFECSLKCFCEDLSEILNGFLDENTRADECRTEFNPREKIQDLDLLSFCGDVALCFLEQILTLEPSPIGRTHKHDAENCRSSSFKNCLGFAARFLMLAQAKVETNSRSSLGVISRVFSSLVCLATNLHTKEDITSFTDIISNPLVQWLTHVEDLDENIYHQLQLLWTEILKSLQICQPPIKFDSSFLKFQAPLLERTFDHPNPSISEATVTFWNSTYGEHTKLDYPETLLPILDKLSRLGKLNLCKRSMPITKMNNSRANMPTASQRCKVTATLTRTLKRVELGEDKLNSFHKNDKLQPCLKRRKPELTEHQKEVRRAQEGRATDCNGHGPGIRTYTSVDFSLGTEESQESQEIRDADCILQMLRRDGKLS